MPSLIDEHTQFTEDGIPVVGGRIYIGTANTDPVSNLIAIYSDRDLTTAIANPQATDADGRAVNKIWVPGKYSIQVNDSAGNQVYQSLDAGELPQTGITRLINVQGTNTITAEGDPLVSTLTDGQQYNFRAVSANTGAVTLQIDLTTAKAIKKQHDVALVTGDIEANQTVSVIYNATDDVFEMVSNPSVASFVDLTVSGDFTYQGTVLPVVAHKIKIVDIGDWNMDTTTNVAVAHGLTLANIRAASLMIRSDADTTYYPGDGQLNAADENTPAWIASIDATNVNIYRKTSGIFDSAGFDSTSFNRGWITITYV